MVNQLNSSDSIQKFFKLIEKIKYILIDMVSKLEFFTFSETPQTINDNQLILHIQVLYQTNRIENPQVFVEEYEIVPHAEVNINVENTQPTALDDGILCDCRIIFATAADLMAVNMEKSYVELLFNFDLI